MIYMVSPCALLQGLPRRGDEAPDELPHTSAGACIGKHCRAPSASACAWSCNLSKGGLLPHAQVYFTGSDPLYAVHGHTYPPRRRDVLIEQPPLVRWSERSHRVFPWAFREAAATFLACHARMSSKNARSRAPSINLVCLGLRACQHATHCWKGSDASVLFLQAQDSQRGCMQSGRPACPRGMLRTKLAPLHSCFLPASINIDGSV